MFRAQIADAASTVTTAVRGTPGGGPPSDLPAPVPEFVTDLLSEIRSFVAEVAGVAADSPEAAATALDAARSLLG